MLPAFIERIISEREEEKEREIIDECRITMDENGIAATHYQEVPGPLAEIIEKKKLDILKRVQDSLPSCVNIQTLPVKNGNKSVLCVCLTLRIPSEHNTIKELDTLCEMADAANTAICRSYNLENTLRSISKDMKPLLK